MYDNLLRRKTIQLVLSPRIVDLLAVTGLKVSALGRKTSVKRKQSSLTQAEHRN
jgi:hypothetical protein